MSLKKIREGNGYSLEQVRRDMEWSISKLIRIENGTVSITVNDLKILLDYYGVYDEKTIESLLDLTRLSRHRHWASEYRDLYSSSYMDFLGYEDDVVRTSHFHPLFVPGLLQTKDYAGAIVTATAVRQMTPEEAEARVRIRMARQRRILNEARVLDVCVAIDESALRRLIGDKDVMRGQIAHLDEVIRKSRADVIIVPTNVGAHIGLTGPFSLLEFDSDQDPDIVYLDNAHNDVALVDDEHKVQRYKETLENLKKAGRKGADARAQLAQLLDELS